MLTESTRTGKGWQIHVESRDVGNTLFQHLVFLAISLKLKWYTYLYTYKAHLDTIGPLGYTDLVG